MKVIELTQGQHTIVDDEDYELVGNLKWCAILMRGHYYAVHATRHDGKREIVILSRLILGLKNGNKLQADHINGDTLCNLRSNLRAVTSSQNNQNRGIKGGMKSSHFKGVTWDRARKKWRAQLKFGGKNKYLGFFPSEEDAAGIYNNAALKYFGEYARLNQGIK